MAKSQSVFVGDTFVSNEGVEWTVLEYNGCKNVVVRSSNGTIKTAQADSILKGAIKCELHPSTYGVGYLGVGSYSKKHHPKIYNIWRGMLERCYYEKSLIRLPTYRGCSVCPEWLNFQNFAKWFEANYIEDYQLDKDIKVYGNKVYSPDTCMFVPSSLNQCLTYKQSDNTSGYYGVYYDNNRRLKWRAVISNGGKQQQLGSFNTPEEAFDAWLTAKLSMVSELDCSDDIKQMITRNILLDAEEVRSQNR